MLTCDCLLLKVILLLLFKVEVIGSQMDQIKDLKVNILLDANRGSRGKENSRTMLLPLVKNEQQCKVLTIIVFVYSSYIYSYHFYVCKYY